MKYVQILIFLGLYTVATTGSEAASSGQCERGFGLISFNLTKDNYPPKPKVQKADFTIRLASLVGGEFGVRLLNKQLDTPQSPERLIAIAEAAASLKHNRIYGVKVLMKMAQIPNLPTEVQQAIIHYAFFRIRRHFGLEIVLSMKEANPPSPEIKSLITTSSVWALIPDNP